MKIITIIHIFCALLIFVSVGNAEILFTEDWESGVIDPEYWTTGGGNEAIYDVTAEAGVPAGKGLGMWAPLDWNTWVRGTVAFPRGEDVQVTFKFWHHEHDWDVITVFPSYAITGPWHIYATGAESFIYDDVAGGLDKYWGDYRWAEQLSSDPNNDHSATIQNGYQCSQSFHDAIIDATDGKNSAIELCFTLGNTKGTQFKWRLNGSTWTVEHDSRELDEYGDDRHWPNSDSPLYLGFAPAQSLIFIDDIVVQTATAGTTDIWETYE